MTKIQNPKQLAFDLIRYSLFILLYETIPMTYIPNLFRPLIIEICDLFEIWCLRFGILIP